MKVYSTVAVEGGENPEDGYELRKFKVQVVELFFFFFFS
jgi:hypothetical protein